MRDWIDGRNPVLEILRAGRRKVYRMRIAEGVRQAERLAEIQDICLRRAIQVERVPRAILDSLDLSHQGVALEVGPYPYSTLADILQQVTHPGEQAFILVLDALQDPQNVGALLRTAEAVGVHGVLLPLRRTALVTPAVVRASSGASEHLQIAQANLAQAIRRLKAAGVWVIGLDPGPGSQAPDQVRLDVPLAIVIGSEGQGMRRMVRESCDVLLRLPMGGRVESLNAAVAGSIALYLAWQARDFG